MVQATINNFQNELEKIGGFIIQDGTLVDEYGKPWNPKEKLGIATYADRTFPFEIVLLGEEFSIEVIWSGQKVTNEGLRKVVAVQELINKYNWQQEGNGC